MYIKVFHHSGRWDRPIGSLSRSILHTRRAGFSIGTRTEMGTKAQDEVLKSWEDWSVYHPLTRYGYSDASIEWALDEWQLVDKGIRGLSTIRIHTKGGHLMPPSLMPWVQLRHLDHGQLVTVGSFHMALSNTHLRRKQWNEQAAALKKWFLEVQGDVIYQADLNRNQQLLPMRLKVNRALVKGTAVRNLWADHRPATGTHGKALLDATLTSLHGSSYLLTDDDSSDHRPYGSTLLLPGR